MRRTIILLMVCFTFAATQAQTLACPAQPSEVCADAWNKYRKADTLWKTGWGLFGAGAGLTVGGLCLLSAQVQLSLRFLALPSDR